MITKLIVLCICILLFCVFYGQKRYNYCEPIKLDWLKNVPIAHRGLFDEDIDENSRSAFMKAVESGYAIELDLRCTKDNIPMVIHDDNLYRLTGVNKKLSDIPFSEAKKLHLLKTGESILSLDELLELIGGKIPLLIEIKSYHLIGAFEDHIIASVSRYSGDAAIQSYNPFTCRYVKEKNPELCVGLLLNGSTKFSNSITRNLKDNLFTAICHPNFIAYKYELVYDGMLDVYRDSGVIVLGFILDGSYINTDRYKSKVDNIIFELNYK